MATTRIAATTALGAMRAGRATMAQPIASTAQQQTRNLSRIGATLMSQEASAEQSRSNVVAPEPSKRSSKLADEFNHNAGDADPNNAASYSGGPGLKGVEGEDKPQPTVFNQSVPGIREGLNPDQKREVEQHNKEFEQSHEIGQPAPEDKVDNAFWQRG